MIYSLCPQGWYIGITAASQAVKAGSTPVPCSKKEASHKGCLFFGFIRKAVGFSDEGMQAAARMSRQKMIKIVCRLRAAKSATLRVEEVEASIGSARRSCPDGQFAMVVQS